MSNFYVDVYLDWLAKNHHYDEATIELCRKEMNDQQLNDEKLKNDIENNISAALEGSTTTPIFNAAHDTTSPTLLIEPEPATWFMLSQKAEILWLKDIAKKIEFRAAYTEFYKTISASDTHFRKLLSTFTSREQHILLDDIRQSIHSARKELITKQQFHIPKAFADSFIALQKDIAKKLTDLNQSNRYSRRRILRILYDICTIITFSAAILSFCICIAALEPTLALAAAAAAAIFFVCSYFFGTLSESAQQIKLSDEDKLSLQTQVKTFFSAPKDQQTNTVAPEATVEEQPTEGLTATL